VGSNNAPEPNTLGDEMKLSLNMSISKHKGLWYHFGSSENTPEGWAPPVGPFKTFQEAVKCFTECVSDYAESFGEESDIKVKVKKPKYRKPKYKVGDVVMLKPCGEEKKPTKAKLVKAWPDEGHATYLIQLPPFNREVEWCGDDSISESDILRLA